MTTSEGTTLSEGTTFDLQLDQPAAAIPHFEQWCGPWSILPQHLQLMVEVIRGLNLQQHLQTALPQMQSPRMASDSLEIIPVQQYGDYAAITDEGIVVAEARGVLMKHVSSLSANTSTVALRRTIRMAAKDDDVAGMMLLIDQSPGGTVAGTQELADDIAAAAAQKPLHAFIQDMGASAAYWIASQATRISANPTAIVGSIGTFTVVHDYSEAAEKLGIKVHVIRAGEFKGKGVPGTEIEQADLDDIQSLINGLNEHFLTGVQNGRGLSRASVQYLADGRAHLAEQAMDLRLIDAVDTFGSAMDALTQEAIPQRSTAMATKTADNTTAKAAEEKTEQPKATETQPKAAEKQPDHRAELDRYVEAFGKTKGPEYFADFFGKTNGWTDSLQAHIGYLSEQLAAETKRADDAEQKLASLDLGEADAVDTGKSKENAKTFAEYTKQKRR